MATFISLLRFEAGSVRDLKESPARLDALKQGFKALGAEMKSFLVLMVQYDALVIFEAADAETAQKAAFATFAGGIRTETMRAFTENEFKKLVASMP